MFLTKTILSTFQSDKYSSQATIFPEFDCIINKLYILLSIFSEMLHLIHDIMVGIKIVVPC